MSEYDQPQPDKEAKAAAKGLVVRRPGPRELFLDLDDEAACRTLWENLPILMDAGIGVAWLDVTPSPSGKPWRFHAVVTLAREVESPEERVFLQALLGSDRLHEALAIRELALGIPDATILFERPPPPPEPRTLPAPAPPKEYPGAYWVTWRGRGPATVNAKSEDAARLIAAEHGEVTGVHRLPYPRRPEINPGETPTLCYGGAECLGQTACPQRYACSE